MISQQRHLHTQTLAGVSGRMRIDLADDPSEPIIVDVHDGDVMTRNGHGEANAVATCDSEATVRAIERGTLNPVVAALQNKLTIKGDLAFAIDVILSLQGAVP